MSFCFQCGNELPLNAKFCSSCGTKQLGSVEGSIQSKVQDFENKLFVGSIKDGNSLMYGFVDTNSNWVIPAIFENCGLFDGQGFSIVKINSKEGVIDRSGNWVIQPIFDHFQICDKLLDEKGYVQLNTSKCGEVFDEQGYALVSLNEKYGFLDRNSNWIIQPIFDKCEIFDENDLSIVRINNKVGCIDRKGNWVFQPIFDDCENINKSDFFTAQLNGKEGIIDKSGNWVIQPIYDTCYGFDDKGYTLVELNEKRGFIDINGNWIIQPIYDYCYEFGRHDFSIVQINDKNGFDEKFGYIDRNGNWVIQPIYDACFEFNEQGLAGVILNNKCGIIDKKGNWVIQPIFDYRYNFGFEFEKFGIAVAKLNERSGVIDRKGIWVIQPKFDYIEILDDNKFIIVLNEKQGLIDSKGEWILEPIYHTIIKHSDNILQPVLSGSTKYGYFSKLNNQWIISPIFDSDYKDDFDLDDYLDEIKSFFDDFDGKLYFEDEIPIKKLEAILLEVFDNYDLDEIQEKSIVYFDDTVWGKGDNGFLIFHNDLDFYLIISDFGGASNYYKISNFNEDPDNLSSQIISVSISKDGILINSINNETDENQEINYFRNDDITKALFGSLYYIINANGSEEEEDDDYLVENEGDGAGIR